MERKIQGHDISEEQIDQWVDEAEAGYDPAWLGKRMGRPTRAEHAAKVVPVRLTDAELGAVMARAEREHLNRSEAIRQALAQWAAAS
ncbi:CopG family transcriptional regulator [Dietzia sp. UCD-THP]|uniref:ribbon-helix-helix protein, CopG family n=1 Tax=Dietzia sp. UCD-THP TaxID=1292020 RepID=UPI000373B2F0|nr:ribbon-helix-helix protein, CopG family [Dietzia sp. UCD-THP]EYT51441.1 CopG family transcriptional regulator [Dietzia sp. UCD-THP]